MEDKIIRENFYFLNNLLFFSTGNIRFKDQGSEYINVTSDPLCLN